MEEEKEPKVTFEYNLHTDRSEILGTLKASDYYNTIWDIQQYARGIYNGKNYEIAEYFKQIKRDIEKEDESEEVNLQCMYSRIAEKMQNKIVEDIFNIISESKYDEEDYI